MVKRIVTSIIAFPVLCALVVLGGLWLKIGICALSVVALWELYNAAFGKFKAISVCGFAASVVYVVTIGFVWRFSFISIIFIGFIFCVLIFLVFRHEDNTVFDGAIVVFGFFYVTMMMSTIYLVREGRAGAYFVWLVFISAWGSDTGAYFVGRLLGKHKLAPILSPKKTIEGAIGGVLVAGLIALIYGLFLNSAFSVDNVNLVTGCCLTGLVGAVFSQIGDLSASAIKRNTGVKDYGNILPGHGGILDRFDSVLFTAPVVYIMMIFLRAL